MEVGASATAAATATGAEAAAHIANAAAATANAQAENANVEATKNLTSSLQEYISVASGRAEIERMQSENSKELRNDIKMYEEAIKDIQSTLDNTDFSKKISDATSAIEKQQAKIDAYKESLANLSPEEDATGQGTNYYNSLIEKAQQKIADLQMQIEGWQQKQQTLNNDLKEYNILLDAAKQIQGGETIIPTEPQEQKFSVDVDSTSLQDLRTQLDDSKSKLQDLEAEADKFNGKPLGDTQKQKLSDLNKEIDDTNEKISVLQDAIKQKNEETFVGSLRNQLSELKEKVSEFGSELKGKVTAPFTELGDKISSSGFGQRFTAEFSQVKAGMEDFKNGAVSVITANGKLQENVGNLTKAIGGLGIPLGGALTGIKTVTKALWGMCATPIGAVIAAIVLGLKAVHTWMTKSAEGQKVYIKLMAFFGSLMSTITDIVVTFGGFLYHCFTDANGPLRDFGKNLVNTFTSAGKAVFGIIDGIGTALKGIFTLNWDTFTSGIKKTWDGITNAGNTVVNAIKTTITGAVGIFGTVKDFFSSGTYDKMSQKLSSGIVTANKMSDLAAKQKAAEIDISKAKKKQAELDIKIAENREKIYQLTGKEKIALIEETKALQRQKYDGIIDAQKKMLSYQQQRMKLHTNSLQDIAKERELSVNILRTEAQRAASTRMLVRQEEAARRSLERQEKSADKAAKNDAKKKSRQNEQTKAAQGKYNETLYNNDQEREKAYKNIEEKIADARISAMQDGFAKTQAERKRQQEKELTLLKAQEEASVAAELKRVKTEFDAQNAIRKAKGQASLVWDYDKEAENIEKTSDVINIRKSYQELMRLTVSRQLDDDKEAERQRLQYLYDYLKEYGTVQEQKYAIAKEYDDKIAKAEDENQRKSLQKEKEKSLAKADAQNLAMNIDWGTAFEGVGNVLSDIAKETLKQVEDYIKTDEFKKLSPESKKSYTDLRTQLLNETGGNSTSAFNFGIWGRIAKETRAYQQSVRELKEKTDAHTKAVEELEFAESWLKIATTDLDKVMAKKAVEIAKDKVTSTEEDQNNAKDKSDKARQDLTDSTTKAANGLKNFSSYISEMSSGSLYGFANGISKLVTSLGKGADGVGKSLGELGSKIAGIAGAILQILDVLGDDPTGFIDGLFEKVTYTVETILEELPTIIIHVVKDIGELVLGIVEGLGAMVGLNSGWLTGSNAKEVKKTIEDLTEQNKTLEKSINDLKDSIDKLKGVNAINASEQAIKLQKQANENYKKIAETQAGYHGNHKSWNHYWGGFSNNEIESLNNQFKVNGLDDKWTGNLFDLSPEQMKVLRSNAGIWQRILDTGKGGYGGRLGDKLDDYIDQAGKLEEIIDQLNETLTTTTKENVFDDFLDSLNDLASGSQDVFDEIADNWQKMVNKMVVNNIVGSQFKEQLEGWYEQLAELNNKYNISVNGTDKEKETAKRNGTFITDSDYKKALDALKAQYTSYVEDAQSQIEQLRDMGIIQNTGEYSQNATSKGVSSITYDQANLLVNLATARNISLEQGNQVRQLIQVDTGQIRASTLQMQSDISVMRDIQEQGLTQITRIETNTRPIGEILSTIQEMYRLQRENA